MQRNIKGDKQMKKTIKEWELDKGIKVKNPLGFIKENGGKKNSIYSNKYTDRSFRRCSKSSIITVKTEKGLSFINNKI